MSRRSCKLLKATKPSARPCRSNAKVTLTRWGEQWCISPLPMATTQPAHFYALTAASVSASIRRKEMVVSFDFSGKRVLLAGLVDEKMVAAGKAFHQAGAA